MDFNFLQNPISKKWVILAPRRAKRPDVAKGLEPVCPFCVGREKDEKEVYRVPGDFQSSVLSSRSSDSGSSVVGQSVTDKQKTDQLISENGQQTTDNWLVRVLPNKFPFAPIHEIIIHSPDHHKNFEELPLYQNELIIKTYRQRFLTHQKKGQVYIFHNRGEAAGESLPHPHTQLAVVPFEVKMDMPRLDPSASAELSPRPLGITAKEKGLEKEVAVVTEFFYLFCPETSQWPDEVWIAPKKRGRAFGEITDGEVSDLVYILTRLIKILSLRHGTEPLPFNFHIYPGGDWYLRFIPRLKSLGGFELGTGIFINTQDPKESMTFIKEHFEKPDEEKIKREHQAQYSKHA